MPGPCPQEFREDVVAVPRCRESGLPIMQIATDLGINEATSQNWLRQAEVEEGHRPSQTVANAATAREMQKRILLPAQENEALRLRRNCRPNPKLGGLPK